MPTVTSEEKKQKAKKPKEKVSLALTGMPAQPNCKRPSMCRGTRSLPRACVVAWRGEELSRVVFLGEEAEELFETNWELEVDNFDDMGLKEEVLRGIYAFGFKEPSPIQQKGILPIIQAKDTIA